MEKQVEKLLIEACNKNGIKIIKGNPVNNKGFVDRIIFDHKNKEIYFVEIKNKTYYQRQKTQEEWAKLINMCGGKYFLIDGRKEMYAFIKLYIDKDE